MTGEDAGSEEPERDDLHREAERRRRRAAVFGDVLPDSTEDDRDLRGSDTDSDSDSERWLRSNVPPHHGTG